MIERKLNKLDGVSASVNYATETASVDYDAAIEVQQLVAAVEAAGYAGRLPSAVSGADAPAEHDPISGAALRV